VVGVMATHPGDVLEYVWDHPQVRPIERKLPCFIALPTTAGTGSEVGRSSVISDDTTHIKKIIFSVKLLATAVFADPELTLDLPPNVTAATGMDALTHNVESYIAKGYHPMCDGIALEGVRIAARALPMAVREPRNLQARAGMLMASMMGAVAFQKDLGATHSCAHALSTVADLHHGLANGIMIDYVMRFNQAVEVERFALMAQAVGVAQNSAAASANAFVAWLTALKREVGIPAKLGAVKVTRQHLPKLLDVAVDDICHKTNPRPCTREDFERIFTEAI
jgi:alcohol dehydrogenase class IV